MSTSDGPDVCVFWNGLLTNQAIPYCSLLLRMPLPRSVRGSQGGRDDSTPLRKRPTTNTTETNMRLFQLEPRQRVFIEPAAALMVTRVIRLSTCIFGVQC